MKKIIYGALVGFIVAIMIVSIGAKTTGAPILTYVYSDSMEPLIQVNDAFLVLPVFQYQVGDIITYRPVVLNAEFITHRIIAMGENGYITKGDNSPYQDQESGEPEVLTDRIVGRVLTLKEQPLVIPGLGNLSGSVQSLFGTYTKYFSVWFFILGILSVWRNKRKYARRPKPRHRLRLRHVYRIVTLCGVIFIIGTIYFGSRVSSIKYLVSEYPGTLGDQIEVNQPGKLSMEIKNNGIVPVWTILQGIEPLTVEKAPDYIGPRGQEKIILHAEPQQETGIYHGYVHVYNYPILFPRKFLVLLHHIHPIFAFIAVGIMFGVYSTLFFKLLNYIHGFESWIPLRSIKDKILDRRYKRAKAKLLGRRRIR